MLAYTFVVTSRVASRAFGVEIVGYRTFVGVESSVVRVGAFAKENRRGSGYEGLT